MADAQRPGGDLGVVCGVLMAASGSVFSLKFDDCYLDSELVTTYKVSHPLLHTQTHLEFEWRYAVHSLRNLLNIYGFQVVRSAKLWLALYF